MKKRLITFRVTEQVLKDMEKLIHFGRYRDKTDVFYDAVRQLAKEYGIIQVNNNNRNSRVKK
ncbi:MAG: hypothetical protein HY361_04600 [Candidatus Aenigmarchaeota archaeon]|nr:hypothetical protein [Candidatus Aenigmarchaeota archaeon]